MTHADVLAAITARGGCLVASFEIDAHGQRNRKLHACSRCGETGHTIARCNGKGNAPRPSYDDARLAARRGR